MIVGTVISLQEVHAIHEKEMKMLCVHEKV